jgi:hypothetical protein
MIWVRAALIHFSMKHADLDILRIGDRQLAVAVAAVGVSFDRLMM